MDGLCCKLLLGRARLRACPDSVLLNSGSRTGSCYCHPTFVTSCQPCVAGSAEPLCLCCEFGVSAPRHAEWFGRKIHVAPFLSNRPNYATLEPPKQDIYSCSTPCVEPCLESSTLSFPNRAFDRIGIASTWCIHMRPGTRTATITTIDLHHIP